MAKDARPTDRMLIAGGGIGGLAAALALARQRAAPSHVLEQAAEIRRDRRRHPARPERVRACSTRLGARRAMRAVRGLHRAA